MSSPRVLLIAVTVTLAVALLAPGAIAGEQATASLSRNLLVNGDSLAVGTAPYLPRALRRWRVTQSTAISRHE